MNMKLEVVVLPVSDVERAKRFYENLGFRLDIDVAEGNYRAVHLTPPHSEASIVMSEKYGFPQERWAVYVPLHARDAPEEASIHR